jgi:hypothetical protein
MTASVSFLKALSMKGTIVGMRWQTGMHGYEAARRYRDEEARNARLPNLISKELVP